MRDEVEKITTDHEEIRKWAEKHHGKPQIIDDPQAESDEVGIRIDFLGKKDEKDLDTRRTLRDISWDDFFKIFEEKGLAFMYEEKPFHKDLNLAYKFTYRDRIKEELAQKW